MKATTQQAQTLTPESRNEYRHATKRPLPCCFFLGSSRKVITGQFKNISTHGLAVATDQALLKGSTLRLATTSDDIALTVAWCKPATSAHGFEVGLAIASASTTTNLEAKFSSFWID